MNEINRKRLEWLRDAKLGEMFPTELSDWNGWGPAVAEACGAALDELASYRGIKVDLDKEIVWIDGIKYARSLFEGIGLKTPLNQSIRIIERSNDGVVCIEKVMEWLPIDTAPVPPPDTRPWKAFRCLVQIPGRGTNPPYVTEGEGYWVMPPKNRPKMQPVLRWRAQFLGVVEPSHWQPLPLPFNESLNEEAS